MSYSSFGEKGCWGTLGRFSYTTGMSALNRKGAKTKAPKLVQSTFKGALQSLKECKVCGFKFVKNGKTSSDNHNVFHEEYIHGVKIKKVTFDKLKESSSREKPVIMTVDGTKRSVMVSVTKLDDPTTVKEVNKLLKIVNERWLNTNDGQNEASKEGDKVVLLVSKPVLLKRTSNIYIVGITTLIQQPLKGFHMDIETSAIKEGSPELQLQLGISRIFVSNLYRRHRLAERMLDATLKHAVYGTILDKWQVGFSQPSSAGAKLLKHWYYPSQTVPVYHEV